MNNKTNIAQLSLIVLAIITVFVIFFFGKTTPKEKSNTKTTEKVMPMNEAQTSDFDTDSLKNLAIRSLNEEELAKWKKLENSKQLENQADFWHSIDRNDIAALYKTDIAKQRDDFETWNLTGDSNVRAYRESADTTNMLYFVNQAVFSYNKALSKKDDAQTKIKLAKIHTEITGQVMNGVMLLRSVVEKEPTNVQANYELGMLSIRSGQDDKAMTRFDIIIENDPSFIEAYLLKSQLLLKQGKKDEAISIIEQAIKHARSANEKEALENIKKSIINN